MRNTFCTITSGHWFVTGSRTLLSLLTFIKLLISCINLHSISFNLNVEWRSDFFHSVRCLLAKRFVNCHTQGGIGNFTYFLEEQNQFALNLSVGSMSNITSLKVVWPNFSCEFLLTLFTPMDFISPYYEVL